MRKINVFLGALVLGILLGGSSAFAVSNHDGSGEKEVKLEKKSAKTGPGEKLELKESFDSTVYVCSMCPEVQSDKPGKCPKCGMNLEKKQVLLTYACPEKVCDYQKAKPGKCPHHDKKLIKTEMRAHCPKCGEQVKPEELKIIPVKP